MSTLSRIRDKIMTVEMSESCDRSRVLPRMCWFILSLWCPRPPHCGDFRKRSGHGPLFPDHVRTMVFSVHLFRTFSAQKVDQRWTVQRGRPVAKRVARLPNRDVTANQGCNGRGVQPAKKSGHGPEKADHVRTFSLGPQIRPLRA